MDNKDWGPKTLAAKQLHALKYRQPNESFKDSAIRQASSMSDSDSHFLKLKDIFGHQRFLPAGRIQSAMGATRQTTAFNCFVSGTIKDSMDDIMDKAKESAQTMRLGGGIGYDFSTLRPRMSIIKSLGSNSSGPVTFMEIYNAICKTISSAGHRRGAQMGVLRVDHPDIEEFIAAKQKAGALTMFNVSVGVTDTFMTAVDEGSSFDLVFEGRVYKTVDARNLFDMIMRSTWDWAEPGVIFLDTMNKKDNLAYCESIAATNPCEL